MRCRRAGFTLGAILSLALAEPSLAQTGTRIIDSQTPGSMTNALPSATTTTTPESVPSPPSAAGTEGGLPGGEQSFVLREVRVEGAGHVDAAAIAALWQSEIGKTVTLDDIRRIADGISALYKKAGYALYTVSAPKQNFAGGVLVLRVAEGYVQAVTIEDADKDADLSLIKAYAARIEAERPLSQATLERYILLMGDLPGYKVGSKFEPIPGTPGAYRLVLGIEQKKWDAGFGFVNLGTPLLSDTEFAVNGVANSLVRDGDRTQLVYGFAPDGFRHYQYYGLNHQTPLGDDGVTLQLNAGYLDTNVASIKGHAELANFHVDDPIIRGAEENLFLNVGFDLLNSNNAALGQSISDERTRAFRATLAYALKDHIFDLPATDTLVGTLSGGTPILGARRGSPAFGSPMFGKFNFRAERAQTLPWDFIFRLRAAGQYSSGRLPESEEFSYGGEDFGRVFDYDTLNGDRGIATAAELAYELGPYHPHGINIVPEIYAWGDWAKIWNIDTLFVPAFDRGASAGIGTRATVADTTILSLELARDIERPRFSASPPAYRVVFTIRRSI